MENHAPPPTFETQSPTGDNHLEGFMAPRKQPTLSRAQVYANITTLLEKVSKIPTPNEYLVTLSPEITAGGLENAPQSVLKEHRWHCRAFNLNHLLHRLEVVFHPDSLKMLPGAEWVLSSYPANPESFTSWETLRQDDVKRVSRVIWDNNNEIRRISQWLSDGMELARRDLDEVVRSTIISKMESLGDQWAMLDAKSEAVVLWFEEKWGKE